MWFNQSQDEVLKELDVDLSRGLSEAEVEKRKEKYGENKLQEAKKKTLIQLFFSQLNDALIYVLLGAAVVTLIVGEYADSVIILAVVFLNATIGVVQEAKAEKAIEALNKLTTPRSLVRRDGETKEINSTQIVPGDVVILDAGRYVPADIRLTTSSNLQIEESALTGESVPSSKFYDKEFTEENIPVGDRTNMAFMSTLVTYGRGEGVVVGTGMETIVGSIAKSLNEETDDMTPLQKRMDELGKTLGKLALGITILMFIIGFLQGRDLLDMLLTSISLAVAAIPEGLPAIVAIVLALGVTRMSKINAIVKKLPAVETLGSVNIICSDKTGTLTQNKMTVLKYYIYDELVDVDIREESHEAKDEASEELIKSFVLCSDATANKTESTGDPTEIALIVLGNKHGMTKEELNRLYPRVDEKPFDSDRKLMSTLNEENGGYRVHTKGAIDNILKISSSILVNGEVKPLTEEMRKTILDRSIEMSNEALRVLGVAYKDTKVKIDEDEMEKDLTVIGFVAMIDPPRLEVKDSIASAHMAGITSIMITGDHKNTAVAIAKELGIADDITQAMTGAEIDELTDEEFAEKINNYRVFARVSPDHKVKIVKAFKKQGNIVSMTGDGVNDAPSLKHADIGVAMGITGTDVSKGAADMILTDDNFTTIVAAIEEGRNIYNNIKKAVIFLLSCNLGEIVAIFVSVLFSFAIPLLPTQILWVNLVTDTLPAISLGVDPGDPDVMKKEPRDPKESFFARGAGSRAIIGGLLIGSLTLLAFAIGLAERGSSLFESADAPEDVLIYARTMAFVVLATSQLFYSLTMRNETKSIFQVGFFKNKYLILSIIAGTLLQFGLISIPFLADAFKVIALPLNDWLIVFGLSLLPLIANEIIKVFMRAYRKKNNLPL
ncbi:calcium-translocating P-type ATPase, PMCA-type [Proteiniclasticum sp. SCR006]|uniref:P-type Ca(2+) transporter n=1 Tax=Proteiniclasticum aestuarii TaxID=2817862 RepID=A0A939KHR7_9CLOT|nr:calcium-translocating P-type ATPase, PMCA-type [Proteiniclasticum aestuarii]MBO1265799.1 calcium-translocating P-type ATPase, PMCA-type [Proteiniclasticum aestuarii]